eukprot:c16091_g1_i2 orf=213-1094(-)
MDSSEAASRRMHRIASHLAASPQNSWSPSLATVVCSSSSGIQSSSRKDGRLLYARQDSHVPAYLRDVKGCQGSNAGSVSQGNSRKDSRLLFARQGSHTQAYFMRKCVETQVTPPIEKEDTSSQQLQSRLDGFDIFSKASSNLKYCEQDGRYSSEEPLFARSSSDGGNKAQVKEPAYVELQNTNVKNNERGWLPRMDIVESRAAYVFTIELPGVNADSIRVEVNNDRLLVSGSRSMEGWIDNGKQSEEALYHRRELSQGPFMARWPIPKNTDIDRIFAEFMDGFLLIHVPKIAL